MILLKKGNEKTFRDRGSGFKDLKHSSWLVVG